MGIIREFICSRDTRQFLFSLYHRGFNIGQVVVSNYFSLNLVVRFRSTQKQGLCIKNALENVYGKSCASIKCIAKFWSVFLSNVAIVESG